MNIEKTDEIGLRRKLFRLFDKAKSIPQILKLVPRSRSWIYKWQKRFELFGLAAAQGAKKTPHHSPHAYPSAVVRTILSLRQRLQKERVGLVGAKAIRRELKRRRLVTHLPSLSTINRLRGSPWLDWNGHFGNSREVLSLGQDRWRGGLSFA